MRRRGGFSLIELLIVIAIILILIPAAIPHFQHAKASAYETGALQAIRTLHTAEVQYSSQYGRYAKSLSELGPPESGERGDSASGVIQPDLAPGEKGGYKFTLSGNGASYMIHAEPALCKATGEHAYYTDETMILRVSKDCAEATAQSPVYGMRGK